MRDLTSVAKQEQEAFFNSFDTVFCDIDGVLWLFHKDIAGARHAIQSLQNLGKNIIFVSNNCTKSHQQYYEELKVAGYGIEKSDLVLPSLAMIDFLKKRNFSQEIYLIGMTPLKEDLENAGFSVVVPSHAKIGESLSRYVQSGIAVSDRERVGAVIADLDVNLNILALQKAVTHLSRPEVLFMTGGSDSKLYWGPNRVIVGPGCFHKVIENASGRKPHCMGKPGPELKNFLQENFKLGDPSRVLFIGDSIPEDMGFASVCGYRKLLVLSGLTSADSLTNWSHPESYKPDYYVDSLKAVYDVLSEIEK